MFFYLSISTFATSEVILFLVQGGMIVQQTSYDIRKQELGEQV